jgi:hypothetical protein
MTDGRTNHSERITTAVAAGTGTRIFQARLLKKPVFIQVLRHDERTDAVRERPPEIPQESAMRKY